MHLVCMLRNSCSYNPLVLCQSALRSFVFQVLGPAICHTTHGIPKDTQSQHPILTVFSSTEDGRRKLPTVHKELALRPVPWFVSVRGRFGKSWIESFWRLFDMEIRFGHEVLNAEPGWLNPSQLRPCVTASQLANVPLTNETFKTSMSRL